MKKKENILLEKKNELEVLKSVSETSLSVITTTINTLCAVNDQIDEKIAEIEEAKASLTATENEFKETQIHNVKIIGKFKALIED